MLKCVRMEKQVKTGVKMRRNGDILRKEKGDFMRTNCESCMYYEYDEEYECYVCDMDLDEDEMARFLQDRHYECPYYRFGDEYTIVRKQI